MTPIRNILCIFALACLSASPAFAIDIPLTVQEPAGVSRPGEQVTSGIPLPPGTQTSTWSLWNGSQEVPLQKTLLPGRTPWILLDFQVDLPASGKASLTLKETAPSVQPASPLSIAEDASSIVVVTGPLKVLIRKNPFNLLETASWDSDGNGIFDPAEVVANSAGSNIRLTDSTSGITFTGDGPPDLISWEYTGPLRSTLRVDGRYRNGSTEFIAYTTRITFYAGKSHIKIDHVLRNSLQSNERHAKISSATLSVGGAGTTVRTSRPGATSWVGVGAQGAAFELVPASLWGIDTLSNNGMILADLSHHGATLVADFSQALSTSDQTRLASAARSPLFATAPSSWYSQYGELSISRFGTLEDEKASYTSWGWTWSASQEPTDAHKPDFFIGWGNVDVHNDLEADDVWQNLIQFLRTQQRGYLDRATGWARYYKWDYALRTDGFDYAWDRNWEGTGSPVHRPLIPIPLTLADNNYITKDVNPGKIDISQWGADHLFGWGLVDYYYLTGEVDALNTAIDIGEVSKRVYDWRVPGSYAMSYYGPRQGARHLLFLTRLYEATQQPKWQTAMNHVADLWLQSPDWDSTYGQYFIPKNTTEGWPVRLISNFQTALLSHAFDRYYTVTGNEEIRKRIVSIADWVYKYGLHPTYQYSGSRIGNDWLFFGHIWHNHFASEPITFFNPQDTVIHMDMLVRGYRYTGEVKYLMKAKYHWDRGSKAKNVVPITRIAGDYQVGRFQNNAFSTSGGLYVNNGDLSYTSLLFYESARQKLTTGTTPPPSPKKLFIK